jgi:hypothetical protein
LEALGFGVGVAPWRGVNTTKYGAVPAILFVLAVACGGEDESAQGGGGADGGAPSAGGLGGAEVGGGGGAGGAGGGVVVPTEVSPLYPAATGWNDYVLADGTGPWDASGADCDPASEDHRGYHSCVHAGEVRQAFVPGETSCEGLTATDALGAFAWVCDDSTVPVRMLSSGLHPEARLADLIDFDALAWRENHVAVDKDGMLVHKSDAGVWWDNPIVEANDAGTLDVDRTIYVVTEDPGLDAVVTGSGIALVVEPGVTFTGLGTDAAHVVDAHDVDFAWIEGAFDAAGGVGGVRLGNALFSVLRHVDATGAWQPGAIGRFGVWVFKVEHSLLEHIRVWGNKGGMHLANRGLPGWLTVRDVLAVDNHSLGLETYQTRNSVFEDVRVFNSGTDEPDHGTGILETYANSNVYARVISASHKGDGWKGQGSRGNVYAGVTLANNGGNGMDLTSIGGTSSSDANALFGVTSVNNGEVGLLLVRARDNHVENLTLIDNSLAGVVLAEQTGLASYNNVFTGALKLGGQAIDCSVSSGSSGLGDQGTAATNCEPGSAPLAITTGVTLTGGDDGVFVGKATADSLNGSNVQGSRAHADITDWIGFANPYRGWGKSGGAFPSTDHRGPCGGGICQIWDFSLYLGNDVNLGIASVPDGDDVVSWEGIDTSATILRSSYELVGDWRGNDDGRCESGEACLYLPNAGGYQGHSLLTDEVFGDGALSGVTLKSYNLNGYTASP